MNTLVEKNGISEMNCGNNFAYILEDNAQFISTEYKVLLSQGNGCFIKCMKMLYNGKIQLYYLLSGYKSFANMIPSLDPDSFMTIAANLFGSILDVKNNGFLSCMNIDISYEHIYVDPNTYKVGLVYLPAGIHFFPDDAGFENELRTGLVKLISAVSTLQTAKTRQFSADLSNGMLTMQDLLMRVRGGVKGAAKGSGVSGSQTGAGHMQLVTLHERSRVVIDITKDEFVIGKKKGAVDGVVDFNKMISRIHCKIQKQGNAYTVTDMQSVNGTYVNMARLRPGSPQPVKNGDILRMADSDFQVIIR